MSTNKVWSRRQFLRSAGAGLALPLLPFPGQGHTVITAMSNDTDNIWSVHPQGNNLVVSSGTITLTASPEGGGTLLNPLWLQVPEVSRPPVQSLGLLVCSGTIYDLRSLNRLTDGMAGGRTRPLRWHIEEGGDLIITGTREVQDVVVENTFRIAPTDGRVEMISTITKNGPGVAKLQLLGCCQLEVSGEARAPQIRMDFESMGEAMACYEFGGDDVILDQDSRATNRGWLLSKPQVEIRAAGSPDPLHFRAGESPACLWLSHRPLNRTLSVFVYASDARVTENGSLERRFLLAPGAAVIPGTTPLFRSNPTLAEALEAEASRELPMVDPACAVARFRQDLHAWKLEEARWYLADGSPRQVEGLLLDAARIRRALETGESAEIPPRGELIYANSFREPPHDWRVFGFARLENDPEKGLFVAPESTVNLWSEREFFGDYIVEFEYWGQAPDKPGCGTFLQLCGRILVDRGDPNDFMASATSRMPDYNFGLACYHFSFNRRAQLRGRTNFRKTGNAFYLLSLTESATATEPRWHTITASKRGGHFVFQIDGEFVLEYFDEGNQGPVLDGGRLGLRNWGGMAAWFRNLKVYAPG